MPDTIRTFIAVKIPALGESGRQLQSVLKSLAAMRRPVAAVLPDNLHVTLKFLGDTSRSRLDAIQQAIAAAVIGQSPFTLRVGPLGAFPNADRPSVVWAGLADAEPLTALVERLETSLGSLGFSREPRPFQPHLTLARIKGRPPGELFELLRRHSHTNFGTAEIRSVEFIRSELHREGAKYSVLFSQEMNLKSEI